MFLLNNWDEFNSDNGLQNDRTTFYANKIDRYNVHLTCSTKKHY